MLLPNDQKKVDYCKENNNGICPYIYKVCDGLCNNCGLNAIAEKWLNTEQYDFRERELISKTTAKKYGYPG